MGPASRAGSPQLPGKFNWKNPYSLALHKSTHERGAPAEGVHVELPPTALSSPGQVVGSSLTHSWVTQSPAHLTTARPTLHEAWPVPGGFKFAGHVHAGRTGVELPLLVPAELLLLVLVELPLLVLHAMVRRGTSESTSNFTCCL